MAEPPGRRSGAPVRQRVRAQIVQQIAEGLLPAGAALPSVRELAEAAGVAPMTVTRVYAELKEAGLVEARAGSGTFVADSPLSRPGPRAAAAALRAEVDALVNRALSAGLRPEDVLALLTSRALERLSERKRPSIVMVGLFAAATESYAARVAAQVADAATVAPLVLGPDPVADAAMLGAADLVVTFPTIQTRVAALVPGARIVPIRFIPAESTRMALAVIDPLARVAVVSRFADFLPVLELGVRRFAPHVSGVTAMDMEAPGLAHAVREADVVVLSTGAEAAGDLARPGAARIEYRHIPDPGDIERLVLPWLRGEAEAEERRKEAS
ncbi:GntR family transcriptional regulator [Rubellimicrobium roseum]|uniref:GntR family transcriptional regulator n=1 Tax=Rubellimicrobium roseum TaxID=687525 RepID=UPI001C3F18F7|nr:GntR family transcriptional regulator [Rubellimicrobium roseum]